MHLPALRHYRSLPALNFCTGSMGADAFSRCASAEPAMLFTAFDARGLRRTDAAREATEVEVAFALRLRLIAHLPPQSPARAPDRGASREYATGRG